MTNFTPPSDNIPGQRHAVRACGEIFELSQEIRPSYPVLADTLDQAVADLSTELGVLPNDYVSMLLGLPASVSQELYNSGLLVAAGSDQTEVAGVVALYPTVNQWRALPKLLQTSLPDLHSQHPALPLPRPRQASLAQFGIAALPSSLAALPRLQAAALELAHTEPEFAERLDRNCYPISRFIDRFPAYLNA